MGPIRPRFWAASKNNKVQLHGAILTFVWCQYRLRVENAGDASVKFTFGKSSLGNTEAIVSKSEDEMDIVIDVQANGNKALGAVVLEQHCSEGEGGLKSDWTTVPLDKLPYLIWYTIYDLRFFWGGLPASPYYCF